MKAGGLIFGIVILAICLIMIVSGIKSIIDKYKSNKKKRVEVAKQKLETLSSWEQEYNNKNDVKTSELDVSNVEVDSDNKID